MPLHSNVLLFPPIAVEAFDMLYGQSQGIEQLRGILVLSCVDPLAEGHHVL
jgi:hypothetical protein